MDESGSLNTEVFQIWEVVKPGTMEMETEMEMKMEIHLSLSLAVP